MSLLRRMDRAYCVFQKLQQDYCNMKTSLSERITIDPEICHGKPCIRGLRYPVETVLEWLSSGMSVEDIEQEDIFAVLDFASRVVQIKRIEMLAA